MLLESILSWSALYSEVSLGVCSRDGGNMKEEDDRRLIILYDNGISDSIIDALPAAKLV